MTEDKIMTITICVIALEIEGTPAAEIILDLPCSRFCSGSDTLERLGLWDNDGGLTDLGRDVRDYLRQDQARHTHVGTSLATET